jgi:hypothetical protein
MVAVAGAEADAGPEAVANVDGAVAPVPPEPLHPASDTMSAATTASDFVGIMVES